MRLLVLAALGGALAAFATWTRPGAPLAQGHGDDVRPPVPVILLDNGFHSDLAVPRSVLAARPGPLGDAVRSLQPGDWIRVGWGDARFYVEQGPIWKRLPDGARAFFRPGNASVLMLDPSAVDPRETTPAASQAVLMLQASRFDQMAHRIEASLALKDGSARLAASRPGDDAQFFASRETFSILHLCNHWTAEMLHSAGVATRPAHGFFSSEGLRSIKDAQPSAPSAELDTEARQD